MDDFLENLISQARSLAIKELKQEFLESENYTALDMLKTKFNIETGERRCRNNGC